LSLWQQPTIIKQEQGFTLYLAPEIRQIQGQIEVGSPGNSSTNSPAIDTQVDGIGIVENVEHSLVA
jgi:hypothetical protein